MVMLFSRDGGDNNNECIYNENQIKNNENAEYFVKG